MNDFYRRVQLLMQLADANERAEKAEAELAAALAANRDCVDHFEQMKAELTVLRYRTGIYTEQERAMDKSFTASEARERERFEAWYTTHAFNYSRDPIGSRDCSLQWEAWKAARSDLLGVPERLAEALRVIRQHVAKDPSALAASIISTCDAALKARINK